MHEQKQAVLNRLSRAIGQLNCVKKMVEDDRDCTEVLNQLSSVKAQIINAGKVILKDHLEHCVIDAVNNGDKVDLKELDEAIDKLL